MADLDSLTLFGAVKKRLSWLGQRQEVLAQNIANANTPDYRASDVRPYEFRELVRREQMQINMVRTSGNQIEGQRRAIRDYYEDHTIKPYETTPDGNAVVLEEQMAKVNETAVSHRFTTEIYRKHLGMLKMALGRSGS
ncbi:MAG: flagellar basal body rod protein FlgB [Rhodospirillales bacterium]